MQTIELHNEAGFRVGLFALGASINSIIVPAGGRDHAVVLAYPELSDYLSDPYFLGATLGQYAGRIAHGQFALSGRRFQLATGDNVHCLHGGPEGFSRRFWSVAADSHSQSATFHYESADGEQGFPGKLAVSTKYSLKGDYGLLIEYRAWSDAETVINLSNHAYFNLNASESEITNHDVVINADHYARPDRDNIPTGEICEVADSRFDFRRPVTLNTRIADEIAGQEQGYDHTFALNKSNGGLEFAASAYSPLSGLRLSVFTTQPALQFYTSEYLGPPLLRRGGLCFEAQNFPDAPNQATFPSATLKPGEIYSEQILYKFESGA